MVVYTVNSSPPSAPYMHCIYHIYANQQIISLPPLNKPVAAWGHVQYGISVRGRSAGHLSTVITLYVTHIHHVARHTCHRVCCNTTRAKLGQWISYKIPECIIDLPGHLWSGALGRLPMQMEIRACKTYTAGLLTFECTPTVARAQSFQ